MFSVRQQYTINDTVTDTLHNTYSWMVSFAPSYPVEQCRREKQTDERYPINASTDFIMEIRCGRVQL